MHVHVNNIQHLGAFAALNYRWIEQLFEVEPSDRKMLEKPSQIIEKGGCIITIEIDNEVVGCCALVKTGTRCFELAKMAVAPDYQGRGLGHDLMRAALAQAHALGAQKIELLTSAKLIRAIALYKAHGFILQPSTCHESYARCDVVMALEFQV